MLLSDIFKVSERVWSLLLENLSLLCIHSIRMLCLNYLASFWVLSPLLDGGLCVGIFLYIVNLIHFLDDQAERLVKHSSLNMSCATLMGL